MSTVFLMTGLMKLFIPELRAAFSGQLTAANIPFHAFNIWFVPLMETAVGPNVSSNIARSVMRLRRKTRRPCRRWQ
ncbi:MAG: hypothetical protein IPM53_18390 [Anaerolineaceae bacterium]|nr:hypothetical protein [Anaerolineaceae bacterium]